MNLVESYFPDLSSKQVKQLRQLNDLFLEWNEKVNLVSRKDTDHLEERHILHSLGIAKVISFQKGSKVLDIGTGGGFPGLPLAIIFPETEFLLVDSIGKKINAVNDMIDRLGLENVSAKHERAEKIKGQFDFIVSRAVTALPKFLPWTKGKFREKSRHEIPNGVLYLKGGDLREEIKSAGRKATVYPLRKYFKEEFFETKVVLYLPGR
jgi:16S rRNA (guanine527-N7)-methyltransferase